MELYIKVVFWIGIITVMLRLIVMTVAEYPRKVKFTLVSDVVTLFVEVGFLVWAGILLFR